MFEKYGFDYIRSKFKYIYYTEIIIYKFNKIGQKTTCDLVVILILSWRYKF